MPYLKKLFFIMSALITLYSLPAQAGGWDLDVGPEIMTIRGQLVCVGCSLK